MINKFAKTKIGVVANLYRHQVASSLQRGHSKPSYTRDELGEWLNIQDLFHHLHCKWVESDYNSLLTPSIDRIDDYLPYSFDNIQLMTWSENRAKYYDDVKSGKNNKKSKAVTQYTKAGVLISNYHSLTEAQRRTGVPQSNIGACADGRRQTAGGYVWRLS